MSSERNIAIINDLWEKDPEMSVETRDYLIKRNIICPGQTFEALGEILFGFKRIDEATAQFDWEGDIEAKTFTISQNPQGYWIGRIRNITGKVGCSFLLAYGYNGYTKKVVYLLIPGRVIKEHVDNNSGTFLRVRYNPKKDSYNQFNSYVYEDVESLKKAVKQLQKTQEQSVTNVRELVEDVAALEEFFV